MNIILSEFSTTHIAISKDQISWIKLAKTRLKKNTLIYWILNQVKNKVACLCKVFSECVRHMENTKTGQEWGIIICPLTVFLLIHKHLLYNMHFTLACCVCFLINYQIWYIDTLFKGLTLELSQWLNGKGTCCQTWKPEVNLETLWWKERTDSPRLLSSTLHMLTVVCACVHTQI